MMSRQPAVAGMFYPGDAATLASQVDALLTLVPPPAARVHPAAMLVPHAGYPYSGPVAAFTLSRVFGEDAPLPDTVILIGPGHHTRAPGFLVWPDGAWRTPLGEVAVDEGAAARLLAGGAPFAADRASHAKEHALEAIVPFLQRLKPDVKIVPINIGFVESADAIAAGTALAREMRKHGVFLIASSDMSHYIPAGEARQRDGLALARLEALDPAGLWNTVAMHRISMCGMPAAVAAAQAARELGRRRAEVVCYDHSGRVTKDATSVVGYAGALIGL